MSSAKEGAQTGLVHSLACGLEVWEKCGVVCRTSNNLGGRGQCREVCVNLKDMCVTCALATSEPQPRHTPAALELDLGNVLNSNGRIMQHLHAPAPLQLTPSLDSWTLNSGTHASPPPPRPHKC